MNIIITAATGYSVESLTPFFKSVERVCGDARVFVIVHKQDRENNRALRERFPQTEIVPVSSMLRRKKYARTAALLGRLNSRICKKDYLSVNRLLKTIGRYSLQIAIERYLIALEITRSLGKDASNILLSDSRDVVFQSDPFDWIQGEVLSGLEFEEMTLERCKFNSAWIRNLYGDECLRQIGANRIVCSGVTMGPVEQMERYLVEMCSEIWRKLHELKFSSGFDQGIHNYLIRTKRTSVRLTENCQGIIATLGYEQSSAISIDDTGQVRVYDRIPAIVHQYERHPKLAGLIA